MQVCVCEVAERDFYLRFFYILDFQKFSFSFCRLEATLCYKGTYKVRGSQVR